MNAIDKKQAARTYDRIMEITVDLYRSINKVLDKDFDIEVVIMKMDFILQFSMMQIALEDYDCDVDEAIFIRDLSSKFDFCDFLKAEGYNNVTWQTLLNTNENKLKSIIREYFPLAKEKADDLALGFGLITSNEDGGKQFFQEIKQLVLDLAYYIALSDGVANESEVPNNCILYYFLIKIDEYANQFNNKRDNENHSSTNTRRSLKDFYVKKN